MSKALNVARKAMMDADLASGALAVSLPSAHVEPTVALPSVKALAWTGEHCLCDWCEETLVGAPGAVVLERDGTGYHMVCWQARKAGR